MRLDKFISHTSPLSRKLARRALLAGRVTLEGQVCKKASQSVQEWQHITLDGEPLALLQPRYLMLHKPPGYLCARQDAHHPCVIDLLPSEQPKADLQLVGRLDKDTTGLLLLTDDGQWNHALTAPGRQCPKIYWLETAEPISPDTAPACHHGLLLEDDPRPTRPADFEQLGSHTARLTLYEGRYHQVKRMLAALGNRVTRLHRESVAGIHLDPALAPGECRALTPEEVTRV